MSGLCGWITTGEPTADPVGTLARMVAALPRHGEVREDGESGPGFGLGLSSHPKTGAWAAEADIKAAIEGYPVWTDESLAAFAAERGHARALARAYADRGEALFDVLQGAFSLALIDTKRGRALLAIDRMGIQPLCYARVAANCLLFGSTTDSIRRHGALAATVSPQAVFNFLYANDRIPAPETIYAEIGKLAPGQRLIFETGRIDVNQYWRMPYAPDDTASPDEFAERLFVNLRRSVAGALDGETVERVGAYLSGGLDSTTVVGLFSELAQRPKAFTIGFAEDSFDETPYARISAKYYGAEHHVYYIQPQDVTDAISKIAAIYDEPFGNSSAVPAYFCALRAKETGVETMLAGDGGDEIFAGNSRYLSDAVFDRYRGVPRTIRRHILEPALAALAGFDRIAPVRRARSYVRQANMHVAERMLSNNKHRRFDPSDIFAADLLSQISLEAPVKLASDIYDSAVSPTKVHRMMHLDLRFTLADGDLRKVSRMCELAGVRVRYPFLEDGLVEFSGTIPPDLLLAGGELRGFYKWAMRDFLPAETLAKKKKGFGLPYLALLQGYGPLRDMARDGLLRLRRRGLFNSAFLNRLEASIGSDEFAYLGDAIWDMMMLDLWFETHA